MVLLTEGKMEMLEMKMERLKRRRRGCCVSSLLLNHLTKASHLRRGEKSHTQTPRSRSTKHTKRKKNTEKRQDEEKEEEEDEGTYHTHTHT